MKIQLERNLRSGSGKLLRCMVCEGACDRDCGRRQQAVGLRTLLCRDDGSIVGDICANCLQQKGSYIQQQLHQRAVKLINQSLGDRERHIPSPHKQALELSELAHQPLKIPPFYVWWWKRLTILTAATRELEQARTGGVNCQLRQAKTLKITFSNEEPSIGKDN
jgi:hypothetical protein